MSGGEYVPRPYAEATTAEMHLGWSPDGKVCLGAGPIRLRFSAGEASGLTDELDGLLAKGPTRNTACGCSGPEPAQDGPGAPPGADDLDETVSRASRRAGGVFRGF